MADVMRELARWILCRVPRYGMHFYLYVVLGVSALIALALALRQWGGLCQP